MKRQFKFGSKVKDIITGYEGVVIGHAQYVSGCDQYLVQPDLKTKNEFIDGKWFDDGRLQLLITVNDEVILKTETGNGCDLQAPKK